MPDKDIPRKRITKEHLLEILDNLLNNDDNAWKQLHDLEAKVYYPGRRFLTDSVRDYLTDKAIADENTG